MFSENKKNKHLTVPPEPHFHNHSSSPPKRWHVTSSQRAFSQSPLQFRCRTWLELKSSFTNNHCDTISCGCSFANSSRLPPKNPKNLSRLHRRFKKKKKGLSKIMHFWPQTISVHVHDVTRSKHFIITMLNILHRPAFSLKPLLFLHSI